MNITKKLTRKAFVENCRYPELAKKVLNQLGASFADLIECPIDYRDAGAGVSGFIYYSETVPFAKRNLMLIMNALNEFESECGLLNKPTDDETAYYNWLAWFALETTVQEVMDMLEC